MTRTDLEQRFFARLSLTAKEWAYALLLGGARQRSNAERADTSDRGEIGNQEVDLHGALGELLLLRIVRDLPQSQDAEHYMLAHLFVETGGRGLKGADLVFTDNSTPVGVDVKTFDCSPWKRYFAINYDKHAALGEDNTCIGYMGLICPRFGRDACITRLIPYSDVSTWRYWSLKGDGEGTISRNLPIDAAMRAYAVPTYSLAASRRAVYPEQEVRGLARQVGERRDRKSVV